MRVGVYSLAVAILAVVGMGAWYATEAPAGAGPTTAAIERDGAGVRPDGARAAQDADGFSWFWTLDGPRSGEAGEDMATDELGNVFIAGHHGGIDMDRDGTLDVEGDDSDPLFLKLAWREGDQRVRLQWVRSFSSPGFNMSNRIAEDRAGGAYVAGAFRETLVLPSGRTLIGAGEGDAYFARFDAEGETLWARAFGGPGQDFLRDVASDAAGNAYLTGTGTGTFALDDRGTLFRAGDEPTAFLASYEPDGAVRWIRMLEGVPAPASLAISPAGEIWLSGEFEAAVDFDGDGTADLPPPRDRDGFYARFDEEGGFLGAWSLGAGPGFLAFADDGDLFLLGLLGESGLQRYGPADFDGDGRPDVELNGEGPDGMWAARATREGRVRWVRGYDLERPGGATSDGKRLVVAGSYHGVRDLDEDGIPERVDRTVDPSRESELAIMVLSGEDGRPERVWMAPGPGRDHAGPVGFDPRRPLLYVSGYIQLTADFTGDGEAGEGWAKCEALGDLFFAEYRLAEPTPVAERQEIVLSTGRAEVSDVGWAVELSWTGARSADINVYRDGSLLVTVANRGAYADTLPRTRLQSVPSYRVCESGTSVCSNTAIP